MAELRDAMLPSMNYDYMNIVSAWDEIQTARVRRDKDVKV